MEACSVSLKREAYFSNKEKCLSNVGIKYNNYDLNKSCIVSAPMPIQPNLHVIKKSSKNTNFTPSQEIEEKPLEIEDNEHASILSYLSYYNPDIDMIDNIDL